MYACCGWQGNTPDLPLVSLFYDRSPTQEGWSRQSEYVGFLHYLHGAISLGLFLVCTQIYLHVNEVNEAALRLYSRCGYEEAPDCASNRAFTNSLGLAGGFIGQRHRLLHKAFS